MKTLKEEVKRERKKYEKNITLVLSRLKKLEKKVDYNIPIDVEKKEEYNRSNIKKMGGSRKIEDFKEKLLFLVKGMDKGFESLFACLGNKFRILKGAAEPSQQLIVLLLEKSGSTISRISKGFSELFKDLCLIIEKSQKINYTSIVANPEESLQISAELQVHLRNSVFITKRISDDFTILAKYLVTKIIC